MSENTFDMQTCCSTAGANCGCHNANRELARAYVPMQGFGELFKPEVALRKGTIFPELFNPYIPCQGHR